MKQTVLVMLILAVIELIIFLPIDPEQDDVYTNNIYLLAEKIIFIGKNTKVISMSSEQSSKVYDTDSWKSKGYHPYAKLTGIVLSDGITMNFTQLSRLYQIEAFPNGYYRDYLPCGQTWGYSGCGPTCASMFISSYAGRFIETNEMNSYVTKYNMQTDSGDYKSSGLPNYINDKVPNWKSHHQVYTNLTNSFENLIKPAIDAGGFVMISVKGPSPYISNSPGHMELIVGYTIKDGKPYEIVVSDPNQSSKQTDNCNKYEYAHSEYNYYFIQISNWTYGVKYISAVFEPQ